MSNQVISFVADENYLPHAKSVMTNCRRQGGWQGDFCMISPGACDTSDMERRGVYVLRIPDPKWDFLTKLWFYTPFFRKWERMLAIDLDVMVQGPLQRVFDGLSPRLPKILMDMEDVSTLASLKQWDPLAEQHEARFAELLARFPHADKRSFNSAFAFFAPASIPEDTMQKCLDIHEEFKDINPSNADQMILNLLLYDRMELAGKDYICFFGCDYPQNRVFSEFRKWRGDEEPVMIHYTRWHAAWLDKTPDAGGYEVFRLGRPAHEVYLENLVAFDTEFPL